jgi:hypothetical protein
MSVSSQVSMLPSSTLRPCCRTTSMMQADLRLTRRHASAAKKGEEARESRTAQLSSQQPKDLYVMRVLGAGFPAPPARCLLAVSRLSRYLQRAPLGGELEVMSRRANLDRRLEVEQQNARPLLRLIGLDPVAEARLLGR